MIFRLSDGLAERCGLCGLKVPAGDLFVLLTVAQLPRCAPCAQIAPEDAELYVLGLEAEAVHERRLETAKPIGSATTNAGLVPLSAIQHRVLPFKELPESVQAADARAKGER